MEIVGHINKEIYRVVSPDIRSDQVVMTQERITHIQVRHPGDFEKYAGYITNILEAPDYILQSNKPHTAFLLKEFTEEDQRFQLILRLAVEGDVPGYQNSVITFLRVKKKRYQRYLRTKKILYKRE